MKPSVVAPTIVPSDLTSKSSRLVLVPATRVVKPATGDHDDMLEDDHADKCRPEQAAAFADPSRHHLVDATHDREVVIPTKVRSVTGLR